MKKPICGADIQWHSFSMALQAKESSATEHRYERTATNLV